MKVVIIEDEKLSAEHLENLLKRIDSTVQVIAKLDSVKRCLEFFKAEPSADLLFVDVHLADGLSFELFAKIKIDTPVIFTTAYDEYAIKAFKLNSVDYLLKPIGLEDLKSAMAKYKKLNSSYRSGMMEDIAIAYQQMNKQYKNRFMVKMGDTIASVKTEEISHFISEDGMVLLATTQGKRYTVDYTLDQLESLIDPAAFFRINRKVMMHINSIQKVSAYFNSRLKINTDTLQDEDGIVSRERVNDFKKWLDK